MQIQHAQAAADQRGRLVLAILRQQQQQEAWILSPVLPVPRHHRRSIDKDDTEDEASRLLQAVTSPEPPTVLRNNNNNNNHNNESSAAASHHSRVYLCCTGVMADATWLLHRLRDYGKILAERYGSYQPRRAVAHGLAQYQRQFWGYGRYDSADDDDDDDDGAPPWRSTGWQQVLYQDAASHPTWGRPLGVRSLVVTCCDGDGVQLQLVEPSGIVRTIRHNDNDNINSEASSGGGGGGVLAMGRNSDLLLQELLLPRKPTQQHQSPLTELDDDALKRRLLQAFGEVLQSDQQQDPRQTNTPAVSLQLEIVSPTGRVVRQILSEESLASSR